MSSTTGCVSTANRPKCKHTQRLTRDVVAAGPELPDELRGEDVVRVDERREQLVVHAAELDGRARIEAPVEVEQRLEDGGEDARAARRAERGAEPAVRVLDDRRRGRRQRALARLGVVVCGARGT